MTLEAQVKMLREAATEYLMARRAVANGEQYSVDRAIHAEAALDSALAATAGQRAAREALLMFGAKVASEVSLQFFEHTPYTQPEMDRMQRCVERAVDAHLKESNHD